jgi:hypothetical protein
MHIYNAFTEKIALNRIGLWIALATSLSGLFQGCSSDEAKYRRYQRAVRSAQAQKAALALEERSHSDSPKPANYAATREDRLRNEISDNLILQLELLKAGYITNATFVVSNLAVTGPQITNRLNRAFRPGKGPACVNLLTEQNRVEAIWRTRDLPLVTKAVLENQE